MSPASTSQPLRSALAFFGLTYLVTWSAWGAVIVLGPGTPTASLLELLGGIGPLVAAGTLSWHNGSLREWGARAVRWRVSPRWWLVAAALPVVLSLLGYAIYLGVSGASIGLTSSPIYVVYPTVFLLVFFLQGGYGEEMGWRGYALPALVEGFSALVAGLVVGIAWAGWHLPQFLIQGSSQRGSFALYLLGVVGLSVVLTWLFVNARRSVLLVVVFHAQWNVFESGALFEMAGVSGVLAPAASTVVVWAAALVLVAVYGPTLRTDRRGRDVSTPTSGVRPE
jgi:membrane protease YdiL (CAAX protease family)